MHTYTQIDRQLHWLTQIIARFNRSFVPSKEDDSHTNLYYDPLGNRITGRWVETSSGNSILTLNLSNFCFEWLDEQHRVVESISALKKDDRQIQREAALYITDRGLDTSLFFEPLHYKIPDYGLQRQGVTGIFKDGLEQWTYFRKLANVTCEAALGFLQKPAETRIWPHHFDTGIYVPATKSIGIGFGLAMEDKMAGQPYFYLAGYPIQGEINYSKLPRLSVGRWEIGNQWKGAILPLDELPSDYTAAEQAIYRFITQSLFWFLEKKR